MKKLLLAFILASSIYSITQGVIFSGGNSGTGVTPGNTYNIAVTTAANCTGNSATASNANLLQGQTTAQIQAGIIISTGQVSGNWPVTNIQAGLLPSGVCSSSCTPNSVINAITGSSPTFTSQVSAPSILVTGTSSMTFTSVGGGSLNNTQIINWASGDVTDSMSVITSYYQVIASTDGTSYGLQGSTATFLIPKPMTLYSIDVISDYFGTMTITFSSTTTANYQVHASSGSFGTGLVSGLTSGCYWQITSFTGLGTVYQALDVIKTTIQLSGGMTQVGILYRFKVNQ